MKNQASYLIAGRAGVEFQMQMNIEKIIFRLDISW